MSSLKLEIIPDELWAERVGARWAAYIEDRPAARLCLPTGSTPRPVYAQAARTVNFTRSEIFVLDEFGLLPGDPARCDGMLERDFLDLLTVRPGQVHTLDPQAPDLEAECRRFESLVDDRGLDLTLLGLGDNGHLGLNEPGSAADSPTRVVRLESSTVAAAGQYGSGARPEWGMTLGLRPILGSQTIWLLVTGDHKARILERMLKGPVGPEIPATYLRHHPQTTVFADESAAGNL